jgi:hypothetical protein
MAYQSGQISVYRLATITAMPREQLLAAEGGFGRHLGGRDFAELHDFFRC